MLAVTSKPIVGRYITPGSYCAAFLFNTSISLEVVESGSCLLERQGAGEPKPLSTLHESVQTQRLNYYT